MSETHRYHTSCAWEGSTGVGYETYSRAHKLAAAPAATTLTASSDPHFRGNPALLNPEQLVVMAASSCQLLSFLAVAARARLDVIEYEDQAEGEMPEGDLPMRITAIQLRPRIVLRPSERADETRVRSLVEIAHRECYIANSLKSEVTVEPTIEWREG